MKQNEEKKIVSEKKKGSKCRGVGLLPISSLCESRYSGLYRDTGCAWPGRLNHDTAGLGHDTVQQCCDTAERKAAIRPGARATRRALRLAGSCVAIHSIVS